jgi:heme O synthase-like polyprenyltransferase
MSMHVIFSSYILLIEYTGCGIKNSPILVYYLPQSGSSLCRTLYEVIAKIFNYIFIIYALGFLRVDISKRVQMKMHQQMFMYSAAIRSR